MSGIEYLPYEGAIQYVLRGTYMIADGSADGTHREPGADCGSQGDCIRVSSARTLKTLPPPT